MLKNQLILLLFIVVISVSIAFCAPINDIFRGVAALPAVGALFAALYQLSRDQSAYARRQRLQLDQQVFSLGATSHMACVIFDKHIDFSEQYIAAVLEAFHSLGASTEYDSALDHAAALTKLRFKYSAWLTPELDQGLARFEKKLRVLGANSSYIKAPKGEATDQKHRDAAAREMLDILSAFVAGEKSAERHPEATLEYVQRTLREALGVDKLVQLRESIVESAERQLRRAR